MKKMRVVSVVILLEAAAAFAPPPYRRTRKASSPSVGGGAGGGGAKFVPFAGSGEPEEEPWKPAEEKKKRLVDLRHYAIRAGTRTNRLRRRSLSWPKSNGGGTLVVTFLIFIFSTLEGKIQDVKGDVKDLKQDVKGDVKDLKGDVGNKIQDLKGDVGKLDMKLDRLATRLEKNETDVQVLRAGLVSAAVTVCILSLIAASIRSVTAPPPPPKKANVFGLF